MPVCSLAVFFLLAGRFLIVCFCLSVHLYSASRILVLIVDFAHVHAHAGDHTRGGQGITVRRRYSETILPVRAALADREKNHKSLVNGVGNDNGGSKG